MSFFRTREWNWFIEAKKNRDKKAKPLDDPWQGVYTFMVPDTLTTKLEKRNDD